MYLIYTCSQFDQLDFFKSIWLISIIHLSSRFTVEEKQDKDEDGSDDVCDKDDNYKDEDWVKTVS